MDNDYLQQELERLDKKIKEAEELLADPTLSDLAQKEIADLEKQKELLLTPPAQENDKNDVSETEEENPFGNRNVTIEVRAGVGGNEAKIWANDLLRMYGRFALTQKWRVEELEENIIKVYGKNVYNKLQFEAGVHRVQRVPVTESSGRIHTSIATVAVLPELEEVDFQVNPEDIEFEAYRASSHGGQNVQKVSTAVRLKHKPTGITVTSQSERYQAQNRRLAEERLRAILWQNEMDKQAAEIGNTRKVQIGLGFRNEKIRTYNYLQDRVTDHRINKSYHHLEEIMDGNINQLLTDLASLELQTASAKE